RRDKGQTLQAATGSARSQRMASSIFSGVQPYSSASSAMDSRALKREAIIAVEIAVPAIMGLPKPTLGLISMILGSEGRSSRTKGKKRNKPLGSISTL